MGSSVERPEPTVTIQVIGQHIARVVSTVRQVPIKAIEGEIVLEVLEAFPALCAMAKSSR